MLLPDLFPKIAFNQLDYTLFSMGVQRDMNIVSFFQPGEHALIGKLFCKRFSHGFITFWQRTPDMHQLSMLAAPPSVPCQLKQDMCLECILVKFCCFIANWHGYNLIKKKEGPRNLQHKSAGSPCQ